MAGLGRAIDGFGDVLENEQNQLDDFKGNLLWTEFKGMQDQKQVEWDNNVSEPDGANHTQGRIDQYGGDLDTFLKNAPQNPRVQRKLQLHGAQQRNVYHGQSFNREMETRGGFYEKGVGKIVSEQILPQVGADLYSAERGIEAVDTIIKGSPGMPSWARERAIESSTKAIFDKWSTNNPDAGAQFEEMQKRQQSLGTMVNPDDTGGLDVKADPAQKTLTAPKPIGPRSSIDAKPRSDGMATVVTGSGAKFVVSSDHAERFRGALDDLEAAGIPVKGDQSGGYANRNIAGTNTKSNHAFGRAIDVNWTENARGSAGKIPPDLARSIAKKWGLKWGGDWSNPDPMHFEVAKDAGPLPDGGGATRVASSMQTMTDASGRAAPGGTQLAQSRTATDAFREMVMKSGPLIHQRALQAERAIDAQQKQALVEQDKIAVAEGVDLFAKKQLTPEWIDANKDRFSSAWTADRFRRMLGDGPRATNWAEYQPIKDISKERPLEAIERAAQLYGERKLEHQDFVSLYNEATREMKNRQALPDYVKRAQADFRQQLRPAYGANEDDWRSYGQASGELERYVQDGIKNKNLNDANLAKFKDKLIMDTKAQSLRAQRERLPPVTFIPKSVATMDIEDVRSARDSLLQSRETMSPEEYNRRLDALRQWDDQIQKEMRLRGEKIPPVQKQQTPGGAQKPAGEQGQSPGGQGSQDPNSPFYDPNQGQQPQKKGWFPWGQPSKLGGPEPEGPPMAGSGGIGSDAVAGGTAGLAQGATPDQQALVERMRGAGVDEATLFEAVRLSSGPVDAWRNFLYSPHLTPEYKQWFLKEIIDKPFTGAGLPGVLAGTYQAAKSIIKGAFDSADRRMGAAQQLPGALGSHQLMLPVDKRGTEEYEPNPGRVYPDEDILAGVLGPGALPKAVLAERLAKLPPDRMAALRAEVEAAPSMRDQIIGKYLDIRHGGEESGVFGEGLNLAQPHSRFFTAQDGVRQDLAGQPSARTADEIRSEAANDPSHLRLLADQERSSWVSRIANMFRGDEDAGKRSSLPGMIQGAVENVQGNVERAARPEIVTPASRRVDNPIRAYHGSPHDFDKFDSSKIGTGEGAQAFGHGLYFAESRGVAKSYQDGLSGQLIIKGKMYEKPADPIGSAAYELLRQQGGDVESAVSRAISRSMYGDKYDGWGAKWDAKTSDKIIKAIEEFESKGKISQNPGRMYEVAIHAKPEEFMDWDLQLSHQPESVKQALADKGIAWPGASASKDPGAGYLRDIAMQKFGNEQGLAKALSEAGIRGIRYKDRQSRGKEGGTYNYVVFPGAEDVIEIIGKDGKPLQGAEKAKAVKELYAKQGMPVPGQEEEDRRVPHLKRDEERRRSDKEFREEFGVDKFGKDDVLRSLDPLERLQFYEFMRDRMKEYPGVPNEQFADEFREKELPKIRRKPGPTR